MSKIKLKLWSVFVDVDEYAPGIFLVVQIKNSEHWFKLKKF